MRVLLVVAYLDRLGAAPDLDGAVVLRLRQNYGPLALPDRDPAPQERRQPHRVGPGRLVFIYPKPRREHPDPHAAFRLILPGPRSRQAVAFRHTDEGFHLLRGIQ